MGESNEALIRELLEKHNDKRDAESLAESDVRWSGKVLELLQQHACKVEFWEYDDFGLVAARPPEKADEAFETYYNEANDPTLSVSGACANFALQCIVHPGPEHALKLVQGYPSDAFEITEAIRTGFLGGDIPQGRGDNEHTKPLREQHFRKLAWWDVPGYGTVAFGRPKHLEAFHTFTDVKIGKVRDVSKYKSNLDFALACVVFPNRAVASQALKEFPALVTRVAEACEDFCASGAKKLGKA